MFKNTIRMPSGEIKDSTAKNAGKGFFVTEDVNEGQPLTLFARNVIPEWLAEIRKRKVLVNFNIYRKSVSRFQIFLLFFLNLCRAIDTFVTITTPAASWTPSQLLCEDMHITVAYIKLLDSPTQLFSATLLS